MCVNLIHAASPQLRKEEREREREKEKKRLYLVTRPRQPSKKQVVIALFISLFVLVGLPSKLNSASRFDWTYVV